MALRVCLVGKKRNGARVIVWRGLFRLSLMTMSLGVLLASAVYLLATEQWNPMAPLAGAVAGLASSILALIFNLFTPRRRLPVVGD